MEKRQFPRTAYALQAQFRADGDMIWLPLTVQNLSAGGLRFRAADELDPGRTLRIKIALTGAQTAMELRGRIVWKQMCAPGVTEHGAEFFDLTEPQQVQIDQLVQFLQQ